MPRKGPPFGRRRRLHWQYWEQSENLAREGTDSAMEINVGGSLRRLREERNLTLRTLAERSCLAINTLSLIENGKSSPSVSTLQQLAVALEVPITAFFETEMEKENIAYTLLLIMIKREKCQSWLLILTCPHCLWESTI